MTLTLLFMVITAKATKNLIRKEDKMEKKTFGVTLINRICLVLVVGLVLFVTSCGKPVLAAEPIKLGALLEFTGALSGYGPKCKDGIEFALEEANWKVAGRPIKIIYEDSGAGPAAALDKAKKLVEVDKVRVIIGPVFTGTAVAIAPYLAENKVIDIGLKCHPIALKKWGWMIVLPGAHEMTTYPLGQYAAEKMGYRTATTLLADFEGGYRFQDGFKKGFVERGGTIIQEQWAPIGTLDFGPYLTNIKKADVCAAWSPAADLVRLTKQYREFGLYDKIGPLIIPVATSLWSTHMQELGDAILGTIGQVDYTWRIDTPLNKEFVKKFVAKYGKKPDSEHHTAYEATRVALAAIKAIGGDTPPEKLRQAFLNVKLENPAGPVSFTPSGYGIHNIYIVKVIKANGEYAWEPIHTYPKVRMWGE